MLSVFACTNSITYIYSLTSQKKFFFVRFTHNTYILFKKKSIYIFKNVKILKCYLIPLYITFNFEMHVMHIIVLSTIYGYSVNAFSYLNVIVLSTLNHIFCPQHWGGCAFLPERLFRPRVDPERHQLPERGRAHRHSRRAPIGCRWRLHSKPRRQGRRGQLRHRDDWRAL